MDKSEIFLGTAFWWHQCECCCGYHSDCWWQCLPTSFSSFLRDEKSYCDKTVHKLISRHCLNNASVVFLSPSNLGLLLTTCLTQPNLCLRTALGSNFQRLNNLYKDSWHNSSSWHHLCNTSIICWAYTVFWREFIPVPVYRTIILLFTGRLLGKLRILRQCWHLWYQKRL